MWSYHRTLPDSMSWNSEAIGWGFGRLVLRKGLAFWNPLQRIVAYGCELLLNGELSKTASPLSRTRLHVNWTSGRVFRRVETADVVAASYCNHLKLSSNIISASVDPSSTNSTRFPSWDAAIAGVSLTTGLGSVAISVIRWSERLTVFN